MNNGRMDLTLNAVALALIMDQSPDPASTIKATQEVAGK